MRDDVIIEVTGAVDVKAHDAEAKHRWGGSDSFRESRRRTKGYGKKEWSEVRAGWDTLCHQLAAELDAGRGPDSDEAVVLAERLRVHIDRWFYPCSHAMHRDLAELYVEDARFAENFWRIRRGSPSSCAMRSARTRHATGRERISRCSPSARSRSSPG